jgi:glucose/arabinose dehydrogenase
VRLRLEPFIEGLEAPVALVDAGDGSGRLFVVEQEGRIRVIRDGELVEEPFLDITDRVGCCGERGLLGLAFWPGSSTQLFVNYTGLDGHTVISSFRVNAEDPDTANDGTEEVILVIEQPYGNHNGGMIAFGPDGYLYIGMGDGGSGGDPHDNGQRMDTLLGKLLRIDVTDPTEGGYDIPPDNPFPDGQGALPEIWSSGLRNPWRFSFDRTTGDLWIGDVGQGAWEEIDRALTSDATGRGANYGWNRMEGRECFRGGGCDPAEFEAPIAVYDHGLGCSVSGGVVYRGMASPALAGTYLFGDYCSGMVWGLASGGPPEQEPTVLAEEVGSVVAFGEDETGEVYLVDRRGSVLRVFGDAR